LFFPGRSGFILFLFRQAGPQWLVAALAFKAFPQLARQLFLGRMQPFLTKLHLVFQTMGHDG
jgi:hypothetical protein